MARERGLSLAALQGVGVPPDSQYPLSGLREFASIACFGYDRRMAQYSGVKSALDSSENLPLTIRSISSLSSIH